MKTGSNSSLSVLYFAVVAAYLAMAGCMVWVHLGGGASYLPLGIGLLAGGAATGLAVVVLRQSVEAGISRCAAAARRMKEGDLRVAAELDRSDELGADMGAFLDGLNEKINAMTEAITEVMTKIDMLRKSSGEMTANAESQATHAAEVAATSEQMSQTILDIAGNASGASATAQQAEEHALSGREIADEAVQNVDKLATISTSLSSMVSTLNSRVNEIGQIAGVINDIADQTNLLALNAAIEAARAGDQGRGFAVVADEVRKLAERTMRATGEISAKIAAVQKESTDTNRSMQNAEAEIKGIIESIRVVDNSLGEIVNFTRASRNQITQIATAVEEQSAATSQVTHTIEESAKLSSETHTLSSHVLKRVDAMAGVIEKLRASFAGFRTVGGEFILLDLAKGDHRLWVNRVAAHMNREATLDPRNLADHTSCRLGKWYYTDGITLCGHSSSFKRLEDPHRRIHEMGKEIITLHDRGEAGAAKAKFKDMERLSEEVIGLLDGVRAECGKKG